MNTLILIPPSEGKAEDGTHRPITLTKEQQEIKKKLDQYDGDYGALLEVKGKALAKALDANNTITTSRTLPAIKRYTGVVFQGLDYQTLSKKEQDFCNNHIRIISALFGSLKPTDTIPNYKLSMTKLGVTNHWQDKINFYNEFILDLLPKTHKKAVRYTKGIEIEFIIKKNGKLKPAGHAGKLVKGKFIRYLCKQQKLDMKTITAFAQDGFKWHKNCFLKKEN